jgi:hypothetical protein
MQCCRGAEISADNSKETAKNAEGPEKLAAEFLPDLHKKGRKEAELFQDLCPMDNLWIFWNE